MGERKITCEFGKLGFRGPCGAEAIVVNIPPASWRSEPMPLCGKHARPLTGPEKAEGLRRIGVEKYGAEQREQEVERG